MEWLEGKKTSSTEKSEDDVTDTKNNLKPPKGDHMPSTVFKKTINTHSQEDGKKGVGTRSSSKS